MPQLDRIIIFSQIFWLFVIFASLYAILTHFFLPKFLKSLKSRNQIIQANIIESSIVTNKSNTKQNLLKQILLKDLLLIEHLLNNELIPLNLVKNKIDTHFIDEKIGFMSFNISLYCDNQLLNLIPLFPKSLNLDYKYIN